MKPFLHVLFFCIVMGFFSNCANGKRLQEEPPVALKQAYYTSYTGGVRGADSGFTLFIPVEKGAEIVMDSVYFRGRKAAIQKDTEDPNLYVAYFKIPSSEAKAPELIMHSDPKKEYGNKPLVILEDMPFEMEKDEAVIKYSKNGKAKFFKISGIQKQDSGDMKIKNPENIRH